MALIKSVAFDTDGVLVDSDRLHFAVFNEILKRHGFHGLTWRTYVSEGFKSYDDREFFRKYLDTYGRHHGRQPRPTIVQLVGEKEDRTHERLQAENLNFFPYVQSVTKHLKDKGILLFEVTGSTFEETKRYFRNFKNIKERFDVVISASDNLPSKPDPAPYREGLLRLNQKHGTSISPNQVIAVEDSEKGVRSAKSAGMVVIGIENTEPAAKLYEGGADIVVKKGVLPNALFDELLAVRNPEELERGRLLERFANSPYLSDVVNVGTSDTPILLHRRNWSFKDSLRTATSERDFSMLLSVPA